MGGAGDTCADATDASRRDAKERVIRQLLPALTEADLDEVDQLIVRKLRARKGGR